MGKANITGLRDGTNKEYSDGRKDCEHPTIDHGAINVRLVKVMENMSYEVMPVLLQEAFRKNEWVGIR